jgi:tripartite-type tricarboxylate transporter receptor subunit TctC
MTTLYRRTAIALCCALAMAPALAQENYPAKPVRIVLPFPPGGSVDAVIRMIEPGLAERLGQPVIIENKPGAGGNIAMDTVAKAPPDGYVVGIGATGALGLNSVIGQRMTYDPLKDLAPVGRVATSPFLLVASPQFKASTVNDVIALGKRSPSELTIGHGGNGTLMQLSAELFRNMAGIDAVLVPYKGTGPATADAATGQVPLAISDPPAALQLIKAGRLKALGVTTRTRSESLPDVPTLAEQGLTGYESLGWFGMVAPAGTPPAVIRRLNNDLNAVLRDPAVRARIAAQGADAAPSTPAELQELMRSDMAKWSALIKKVGLKFD